jgi:hypothetical protein
MLKKLNIPDRIFLMAMMVLLVLLSVLSFHILRTLNSDDSPDTILYEYHTYDSILVMANPIGFVILLVLSNVSYVRQSRGFFFLVTFLIFAIFTMMDYAYISDTFFHFRKRNGMWKGEFSIAFLMGVILCVIAGAVALVNYLVLATIKKHK